MTIWYVTYIPVKLSLKKLVKGEKAEQKGGILEGELVKCVVTGAGRSGLLGRGTDGLAGSDAAEMSNTKRPGSGLLSVPAWQQLGKSLPGGVEWGRPSGMMEEKITCSFCKGFCLEVGWRYGQELGSVRGIFAAFISLSCFLLF